MLYISHHGVPHNVFERLGHGCFVDMDMFRQRIQREDFRIMAVNIIQQQGYPCMWRLRVEVCIRLIESL